MATHVLETNGEVCPFPLIEAKQKMEELNTGDELVIGFDCTQGTESIPRWAATEGHGVKDFKVVGDAEWSITVVKK
ncbi:oxidoreductase [Corynebacterium xerosis]|nr:oxidoreductase [Corynebacterium xerosis]SQB96593.1 SirA family protein [Clostridium paraputrificum]